MRARFLPVDGEGVLFQQYQHCFQRNRSVGEYMCEFHRLSSRNNLSELEEQLVARFVRGLKSKLQEKLIMHPQYTLMDSIRVAECLECFLTKYTSFSPGVLSNKGSQPTLIKVYYLHWQTRLSWSSQWVQKMLQLQPNGTQIQDLSPKSGSTFYRRVIDEEEVSDSDSD